MKTILLTLSAVYFSLLLACNKSPVSDADMESNAKRVIQGLDSATVELFKTWQYRSRGPSVDIWTKNAWDSAGYRVILVQKPEDTSLFVMGINDFQKDFPVGIELDTVKYWRYTFRPYGIMTTISAVGNSRRDTTFQNPYKTSELFPSKDPFKHFLHLSHIKNSLGILETSYNPRLGDFVQFYISPYHVLTYMADTSTIDRNFKHTWRNIFSKGQTINQYWNLRKREQPLDGG